FFLRDKIGHLVLAGVETNRYDLKIFAEFQRKIRRLETVCHAIEHLSAEHWAAVVRQDKNHRLVVEIAAEPDLLPLLIMESQIESDLRAEVLIDADVLQERRQRVLRAGDAAGDQQCNERVASSHGAYFSCLAFAPFCTGKRSFSSMRRMATSIGMLA